jgi:hypothetical protein
MAIQSHSDFNRDSYSRSPGSSRHYMAWFLSGGGLSTSVPFDRVRTACSRHTYRPQLKESVLLEAFDTPYLLFKTKVNASFPVIHRETSALHVSPPGLAQKNYIKDLVAT